MKDLRVLLVTRRFWPLVGDAEDAMADLACGLPRHGVRTTVVTAQCEANWPAISYFDTTPVHRLRLRSGRLWSQAAYLLGLARWLRRRRDQFDVAVVAGMRQEAWVTLWALGKQIPVVLRAEADDAAWQATSLQGARCRNRCRRAAALVARDAAVQQILLRAGYPAALIHRIADGLAPGVRPSAGHCLDARRDLAAANGDLTTGVGAPVVVYSGPLVRQSGLAGLVRAWPPVVRRWPSAKLWLIGDGPYRETLFRLISDLELRDCVLMPGTFEDADQVLQAADLLVHPGHCESLPRVLLAAVAAGLPIVARATPAIQMHPTLAAVCSLVPTGTDTQWSGAIIDSLATLPDPPSRSAHRRTILRDHSMTRMLRDHLALVQLLHMQDRTGRSSC